jgi:hypothetical protein
LPAFRKLNLFSSYGSEPLFLKQSTQEMERSVARLNAVRQHPEG